MTTYNTMFWLLSMTAVISLVGIIASAKSLRNLVKSEFFLQKLRELKDNDTVKTLMLFALLSIPSAVHAEAVEAASEPFFEIGFNEVLAMAVINLVLIGIIFFLRKTIKEMMGLVLSEEEKAVIAEEEEVMSKVTHILTDAVAVEDEHTILLDHEYDGIQELDNNLPPWWKWMFNITIIAGVLYMLNYHVLKLDDLQEAEYHKTMVEEDAKVQAYLESLALNVDENTAVDMLDVADLTKGKNIFNKNCAVCHLEDGGGQVGPNLTDDYWLYGPDMKNIFKTIKYGANNGMTAWKEKLTPIEIQQVSSYIRTLHGTTPAVAKPAQGEFMEFVPIGGEAPAAEDAKAEEPVADAAEADMETAE